MVYSLVISLDKNEVSSALELTSSIYSVGRSLVCDVVVIDCKVSRLHCCLILMPSDKISDKPYFIIRDGALSGEKSANGTWVNGQRVAVQVLHNQDEIRFGENLMYPKLIFLIEQQEETIEHPTIPVEYEA